MILKRLAFACICAISFSLVSCGGGTGNNVNDGKDTLNKKDTNQSLNTVFNGKIFSVPSPFQTAFLIKKTGAAYAKDILNPSASVNSYSTNYQKALNLGVYGADLGYVTLYDQTQDALGYFQSVKKLADDLGVSAAFSKDLLERFQKNLGKRDSMLNLVSSAYRSSNDFLKNNDRNEVGALIIAGGWIESLHFAVNVSKQKQNDDVIKRIAEQKTSLESVIGLMEMNAAQDDYAELIKGLKDLKADFDAIQYKYVYDKPVTDEKSMTTTFTSKTEVVISPEQLESISKKVAALRKLIVG
jgi:hypothetical protein